MSHPRSACFAASLWFVVCLVSCRSGNGAPNPTGPDAPSSLFVAPLAGDWVLVSTNRPSNPSGVGIAIKSFTKTDWVFTQTDPATGVVVFRHGGRYTLTGTEYVEYVDYANPSTANLIGETFAFTVTFEGDTHRQVGLCCGTGRGGGGNSLLDSVWKRVR